MRRMTTETQSDLGLETQEDRCTKWIWTLQNLCIRATDMSVSLCHRHQQPIIFNNRVRALHQHVQGAVEVVGILELSTYFGDTQEY